MQNTPWLSDHWTVPYWYLFRCLQSRTMRDQCNLHVERSQHYLYLSPKLHWGCSNCMLSKWVHTTYLPIYIPYLLILASQCSKSGKTVLWETTYYSKKIVTSQNCTFVSNFRTLWNAAFCLRCLFTVTPTPVDVVVGCSVNEECPEYAACLNGACRNPCAYDDPCAPNAFCKTIFHTAKCACPDGYIGDPQIECKLPRKIEIT